MDILKVLISDNPNPVIIFDKDSRKIIQANDRVMDYADYSDQFIGQKVDKTVNRVRLQAVSPKAFLGNTWFDIEETPFTAESVDYVKLVLKKPDNTIDQEHIAIMKRMIATLLHRLRSPLTGMQGYVEFMRSDIKDEKLMQRLDKINYGIDELFNIMDELEKIHDVNTKTSSATTAINVTSLLNKILLTYDLDIRSRIHVECNSSTFFNCTSFPLEHIFSALLRNAVEQSELNKGKINIHCNSDSITFSNGGEPIPKNISRQLFYPFVTTKACNLGIGLTLAQLYAKQISGLLFLSQNSPDNISFTLYLPHHA